jgi:hypothetical protein
MTHARTHTAEEGTLRYFDSVVIAVPAISIMKAMGNPDRDGRNKSGHDKSMGRKPL